MLGWPFTKLKFDSQWVIVNGTRWDLSNVCREASKKFLKWNIAIFAKDKMRWISKNKLSSFFVKIVDPCFIVFFFSLFLFKSYHYSLYGCSNDSAKLMINLETSWPSWDRMPHLKAYFHIIKVKYVNSSISILTRSRMINLWFNNWSNF